jgi:hypothetical protein
MNTVHIRRVNEFAITYYIVTVDNVGVVWTDTLEQALTWSARNRHGLVAVRPHFGSNDAWRDPSNYSNRY